MGSHIECYFSRSIPCDSETIRLSLEEVFSRLQDELRKLKTHPSALGNWWVKCFVDEQDKYPQGEGPHHFSINVYEFVVVFECGQRFHKLYASDSDISHPLRMIICEVACTLGEPTQKIVVASGGFGETDHAYEAALNRGTMEDIIQAMRAWAKEPAGSWKELESGDYVWYLGPPTA
jgi:hypothetical protein